MSLVDIVSDHLFNDDTKKAIIDGLNEKIDIPIINERTEERILNLGPDEGGDRIEREHEIVDLDRPFRDPPKRFSMGWTAGGEEAGA